MSTKPPVRVAAIALVVASAIVMSGCSALAGAPESVALSSERGWPTDAPGPPAAIDTYPTPPVGWVAAEGDRFWLVTWGSSTCVFIPTEVATIDDTSVAVRFEQAPAEACTDDLAPRAHELAVPEELVGSLKSAEVTIIENAFRQADADPRQSEWTVDLVGGWSQTIAESFEPGLAEGIPAGNPESFAPRVLARGVDDPITLVTYYSTTCPLLPIAAEVEGGVLAITVRERPAGACTADIAPTTSHLPPVDGFDPAQIASARVTTEPSSGNDAVFTVLIEPLG